MEAEAKDTSLLVSCAQEPCGTIFTVQDLRMPELSNVARSDITLAMAVAWVRSILVG
jgi:hypothetical protein